MFFERDEFEEKLVHQLLKELDDDKINVTEDLIQRTMSAVKKSEHLDEIESEGIGNKGIGNKGIEIKGVENKETENVGNKEVWSNDIESHVLENEDINTDPDQEFHIETKRSSRKKTLVWIRRVSTLVAACFIFIICMRSLSGSKKSENSTAQDSAMPESGSMMMDTTSSNEKSTANGKDRVDLNTATTESNLNEAKMEEESGETSDGLPKEEIEIHVNADEKADVSMNNKVTAKYGVNINDILTKDQSEEADEDTTYISLYFDKDEEIETISSMEELIASLNLKESSRDDKIKWIYKIYMQTSRERAVVYFISDTNHIKIQIYGLEGLISDMDYEILGVEDIVEQVKSNLGY